MSDKPYEIIDGKIYPRKAAQPIVYSDEIVGSHWRIWRETLKCFLEYDEGHFATKMVTVEISDDEYRLIENNPIAVKEIIISKQTR
jgi:hypothetical protein